MAREKIEYSKQEMERDTHFMLIFSSKNLDTEMLDIVEAGNYVKNNKRKCIIVPGMDNTYKEKFPLSETNFSLVMNLTKPEVKIVKYSGDDLSFIHRQISSKFKCGAIILGKNCINDEKSADLYARNNNANDILIHKDDFLDVSNIEAKKATIYKVHYTDNIKFGPQAMQSLVERYGEKEGIAIFKMAFIAYAKYDEFTKYINKKVKELVSSLPEEIDKDAYVEELIDREECNYIAGWCSYYDVKSGKIIGISKGEFIKYSSILYEKYLGQKLPDDILGQIADTFI